MLSLIPTAIVTPRLLSEFPFAIEDDTRHYVVWLRQLIDPSLFPNDFIAEHLTARLPWLNGLLYRPLAAFGMDPLLQNVVWVRPLTSVLFGAAAYWFIHQVWRSAIGATLATALLFVFLGIRQGLPHDFGYTMVFVALIAFRTERPVLVGASLLVAGGLLPVIAMTAGMTIGLLTFYQFRDRTRPRKVTVKLLTAATLGSVVGVLPTLLRQQESGPTMSAADLAAIPFFQPEGMRPFFGPTAPSTYLCNSRAGITPLCFAESDAGIVAWTVFVAFLLVAAIWLTTKGRAGMIMERIGLPPLATRFGHELGAFLVAGLILFPLAHAVALRLHFPERVARYTIGTAVACVFAIVGASVIQSLLVRLRFRAVQLVAYAGGIVAFAAWAVRAGQINVAVEHTTAPAIHEFLQTTPRETLVASSLREIDNVPAFSSRRVLASMELLVSHKRDHFAEHRRRFADFAQAMYSIEPGAFGTIQRRYGIDYVIVEKDPSIAVGIMAEWARSFPELTPLVAALQGGAVPFFRGVATQCARAEGAALQLLDAQCLVGALRSPASGRRPSPPDRANVPVTPH